MYQEGVAGCRCPSWYVFQICVCDYHIPTARAPVRGAATRRRIIPVLYIRSVVGYHTQMYQEKGGGGDQWTPPSW